MHQPDRETGHGVITSFFIDYANACARIVAINQPRPSDLLPLMELPQADEFVEVLAVITPEPPKPRIL